MKTDDLIEDRREEIQKGVTKLAHKNYHCMRHLFRHGSLLYYSFSHTMQCVITIKKEVLIAAIIVAKFRYFQDRFKIVI